MSVGHARSSDLIDAGDSALSDEYSPAATGQWTDDEERGATSGGAAQALLIAAAPAPMPAPLDTDLGGPPAQRPHRHRKHRRSRDSGSEADSEADSSDGHSKQQQRGGGGGGAVRARTRRRPPARPRVGCCERWLGANSGVLWLFTLCQLMIFYDRGMVAGFLPSIQHGLGPDAMSDTQMGLLGSGFIFGYMLACPLFAFFSKSYSPYKLMAIGLFLWVNAVLLCGLTDNFMTLLGARILTGVGEASFAGLAPTCIDDVAPTAHRTIWLSFFFAGIPIGSALGYIAGGWFASGFGWHWGFLTEAVAMIPIMVIVFFWPNHVEEQEETTNAANASAAASGESEAEEAGSAIGHRWQRRRHSQRLHAEPPTESSFYDPSATPLVQGDVVAPLAELPQYQRAHPATNISRSISTPALKRLDAMHLQQQQQQRLAEIGTTATHDDEAIGEEQMLYADADEEKNSQGASVAAVEHTPLHQQQQADERKYVPASPSYAPVPALVLSVPSSPAPRAYSNSHAAYPHSTYPHPHPHSHSRGSRTPSLRDAAYIVPDPTNPYHAPGRGQHYRESAYGVATPRPDQWGGSGSGVGAGARTPQPDPLASLPSPGSFNPHYAVQLAEASRNEEMFVTDVVALLTDGVYIVVVLGYAALAFVIGALSFWAPVDFSKTLDISIARSTQIIGVITFCCGLGGTFFGGWCMDYRGGSKGIFAVISALELCCVFVSVSIVFALCAVLAVDLTSSMVCLALADFFLFGTGAPINAALLSVAPKNMRSLAMAMSILLMHALGDLPSPFLMGYITDQVSSIRLALVLLILWLLWTVLFWAIGVRLARRRAQQFKEQLSKDMARPAHERSALLVRRGSTGQFYSNAARGQRGGSQSRAHAHGHAPHPSGSYSSYRSGSHSGSSTPTSQTGGRYPHRDAHSHARGPHASYGSSSPAAAHSSASFQAASQRSASPAVGSRALQQSSLDSSLLSPPLVGVGVGFVALPVYDSHGQVVAYTQAPTASANIDTQAQQHTTKANHPALAPARESP